MDEFETAKRRYYALMVVGVALPLLISPFLSSVFLSASQSFTFRLIASRFLIWVEFGIMMLYAQYAEVQRFMLWDEERYSIGFYAGFIILLFIQIFGAGIIARIPVFLGFNDKNDLAIKMQAVMNQYPALLAFTAITAGITEEVIFRGYMIPRLSLMFNNRHLPVIISAALFSFMHLGYKNLGELIFTFLFGLMFGYHYQKYRSIQVLVMVHFLWDLMAMMIGHYHK